VHFYLVLKLGLLLRKVDFGSWRDHVKSWCSKKDDDVLVLRYEEMKEDIVREIEKIVKWLQIKDMDSEHIKQIADRVSFETMKGYEEKIPPAVLAKFRNPAESLHHRKGIVGDYLNYWKEEQIQRFYEKCEKEFAGTDIPWRDSYSKIEQSLQK